MHLISRIEIAARLKTRIPDVERVLSCYPALVQTRQGSAASYLIEDKNPDRKFGIELLPGSVAIIIYSWSSPFYYTGEAVAILISILAILKEHYDPEIKDLYPYLISSFLPERARRKLERRAEALETGYPKERLPEADYILAGRIVSLLKETRRLNELLTSEKKQFASILARFLLVQYGSSINRGKVAAENNIDESEVNAAIEFLKRDGYSVLDSGNGDLSLVKA